MKTLDNLRKVTFVAYVSDDEAEVIEQELWDALGGSDATLARGNVDVEKVEAHDYEGTAALGYFQELDESDAAIDQQIAAETIDLTPTGMLTPEGVAKVNEALDDKNAISAEIVQFTSELQKNLLQFARETSDEKAFLDELADASDELEDLLAKFNVAQEAFFRAIAGR